MTLNNVSVVNGVFTVQLDFGNPFWKQQNYLEVRVRKRESGSFTTLAPRQLPAPCRAFTPIKPIHLSASGARK